MTILFSLRSKNSYGRCYYKTDRATIFLSNIFESYERYRFYEKILDLLDTIHHEILHLRLHEWKIRGNSSEKIVGFLSKKLTNMIFECNPKILTDLLDIFCEPIMIWLGKEPNPHTFHEKVTIHHEDIFQTKLMKVK